MVLRPLLTLTCLLSIMLVALNLLASKIGSLQPPNPALVGFVEGCEDKRQPCWYGIVPGVTTAEEAESVLTQLGYSKTQHSDNSYTLTFFNREAIPPRVDFEAMCDTTQLDNCGSTRLLWLVLFYDFAGVLVGDIYVELGPPSDIEYNNVTGLSLSYPQTEIGLKDWILPFHQIEGFTLYSSVDVLRSYTSWDGFIPLWRYCQLEPLAATYCS